MRSPILLLCLVLLAAVASSGAVPEPLPKPAAVVQAKAAAVAKPVANAVGHEAFFESCSSKSAKGDGWVVYGDHCYLFVERQEYWYEAMQYCKNTHGGNLVSIRNRAENIFVSKLTYCQKAWLGRYAVSVDHLRNASNYLWTDGSPNGYHAHDFNSIHSIHMPLIAIQDLKWFNNLYHMRQDFVCKVPNSIQPTGRPSKCPDKNWKHLNGYCYYMPSFKATYIESDFYCRGRAAHVASVHDDRELRAISLLDLSTETCPLEETWLGLVKLNPCRVEYSTGKKVCFRWSDRSGDYKDFPEWHPGSPNNDEVTNCVALKDRNIRSAHCYERLRFVCKKKAS